MSQIVLRTVSALSQIDRDEWDAIANPASLEYDPFLSWDFLDALETSGSASEATGWLPRHMIAETEDGELVGALPLYAKGHSQGEYVFDHGWADAYERAGGQYYPKLLTAIPFTPVTGRRVLAQDPAIRDALIAGIIQTAQKWGISSWHLNFPTQADWMANNELGLLRRMDRQYVWFNRGYETYEDFLAALASRKRKALKKERAAAQAEIEIERLSGEALSPSHWDVFFACYQDTGARKWGSPYLNRDFFDLIHRRMADKILLVMAKADGRYIASALNFIGSDALYGRYWGRLEDRPYLHFELCYHQAIDAAIELGLARVEAGAQGEHKLARGYEPTAVYSNHWIAHEGLRDAVGDFLERERDAVEHEIALQRQETPFKVV
ncbi:MAG: N-acetyltransferase [Alphaproteobacteria bacterium]|nr:N-acetyltransferase [Alphaproteobacteria bacterium]